MSWHWYSLPIPQKTSSQKNCSRCLLASNLLDIFWMCDTWQNSERRGRCGTMALLEGGEEFMRNFVKNKFSMFVCASKKITWNVTLVKSVFRYKIDF
jgi:hypothetical protein